MAAVRGTRRFHPSDERVRDLSVHPGLVEGRLSTLLGHSAFVLGMTLPAPFASFADRRTSVSGGW
jgi:hypothetical protein